MNEFHVSPAIVVTTKHKTVSVRPIFLIFIALTGCICTFTACFSMIDLEYRRALFWTVTIFSVLLTSILSLLPNNLHFTGYIPIFSGALAALLKLDKVILGAKIIYNYYYFAVHNTETQFFEFENELSQNTDLSWFLCCVSVILCGLISRAIIRKTYFIPYFLLTFIPIEFGLYEGLNMNIPSILILVATWFCVLSLQLASQHGKKTISYKVSTANIANCGIAALAITISAVIVSVIFCNVLKLTTDDDIQIKRSELRSDIENIRWEDITKSIANLGITLGFIDDPNLRELGTKSKLEYRYEDDVQITLSELPDQSIYLKNFTGSIYKNNSWTTIDDEEWEKNKNIDTLFTKFECVPQILPFMSNQSIYDASDNASIIIKPLHRSESILLPYASYGKNCVYSYDTGCTIKEAKEYRYSISLKQNFYDIASMPISYYYLPTNGFNFNDSTTDTFFSQLDVNTNDDAICISAIMPPYIDDPNYKTQALQAALAENYAYRQFVYDHYTDPITSEELNEVYSSLPYELYETAQNGNTIETLKAIRKYLDETSEYTTSPGETPSTRDFINYFLLENNKGYCMHFATAGTILARYFNIPARYCEGYIVSSEMMENGQKNDDGSITVNIPDSSAHAWCEYYIDGYGWVPYELTPGYYTNAEYTNPEPIEETTDTINAETETQTETSIVTTTVSTTVNNMDNSITDITTSHIPGTDGSASSEKGTNSFLKVLLYIFAAAALIAVVVSTFILVRNYALNKRKRSFNNSDTIVGIISIYKFLMNLLKYQSIIPENNQLLDFAELAKEKLNLIGLNGDGAVDVIKLTLAADMGGKTPSREEINTSIKYVNSLALSFRRNKSTFAYLNMKYIHHFF